MSLLRRCANLYLFFNFFFNINHLIFMCFYTFIIGCHRLLTLFFNKFVKVGRILIEWTGLRQCIQGGFSRPLYVSKLKIWVRYCQLTLWVKIRGYNKKNWKYISRWVRHLSVTIHNPIISDCNFFLFSWPNLSCSTFVRWRQG